MGHPPTDQWPIINPTKKTRFWSIEETSPSSTIQQGKMSIRMEVESGINTLDELVSMNMNDQRNSK